MNRLYRLRSANHLQPSTAAVHLGMIGFLFIFIILPPPAFGARPSVRLERNTAHAGALPRSTPEKEGVSSRGLLEAVEAMDRSSMELHSLMVVRHGHVIAEGWWDPYAPDLTHTMYSVSKSFTATAIGFAVSEHRLTVDDKVISFFPDDLPDTISANLSALRVRDLLSMSAGQDAREVNWTRTRENNWVKAFLSTPFVNVPGTKFVYNSLATYMLSAIVQKVTGQRVFDYLTPRLFSPLQITGIDWEMDPRGINTGGWGLRLKTEDMAKFGLLFLHQGEWQHKQIVPKAWIVEATTMKILQSPDMPQAKRDSSDWQQGYCYQMWRCRHNAFRGDGAFGQLLVVMPEQDAVVIVTAETSDMQSELNLVWKYILPAMKSNPLPANRQDAAQLRKKLAALAIPPPLPVPHVKPGRYISGKTYVLDTNAAHLRSITFGADTAHWSVTLTTDSTAYPIAFGSGTWVHGTTRRRGPDLVNAKGNSVGLPAFKIAGSYRWLDEHTLELTMRYIESPHTETITCTFDNEALSLSIRNSLDRTKPAITLAGAWKKQP